MEDLLDLHGLVGKTFHDQHAPQSHFNFTIGTLLSDHLLLLSRDVKPRIGRNRSDFLAKVDGRS